MPQTLAQMVKAKYPSVYDDMPDADLEAKVSAKYPKVYDDIPRSTKAALAKRSPTEILRGSLANAGSFGTTPQPADMPEGAAAKLGLAGTIATLPMIPATGAALVAAPVATGKAILGGLVGSAAGTAGGEWVGHKLPIIGGETAAKVLGTVGGLVGGVGGAATAPKMTAGRLLQFASEGRGGVLQAIFGSGEAQAVTAAREAAAAEASALRLALQRARLEKTVAGTKALEQRVSDSMRKVAVAEAKEARLAKKAGLSVPDFRAVAAETAPTAAPIAEQAAAAPAVLPAGQRAMPTNLGGAAKPGAAPTPPEKLEEALQATLDAMKAKKAGAVAPAENLGTLAAGKPSGALQPERVQIGAERVGKPLGMTKEQVRMEAGPVLNEARGEASPLLPKQAYASIAEKIKALPRGEARDAYVKLANSEKAMWNVEAIRRTLETQGLVLPFAAVAGLVIQAQEK
jgi:hypothetical protein